MSTPAGWYPDPEQNPSAGGAGTLRWWDGTSWTENRTAAPQSSVGQAAGAQGTSTPASLTKGASTGYDPQGSGQQHSAGEYGGQQQYGGYGSPPAAGGGWAAAPAAPGAYGGAITTTPAGEPLAGRGRRLAAKIIDFILVSVVGALLASPFLNRISGSYEDFFDEISANPQAAAASDPIGTLFGRPGFLRDLFLASLVSLIVSAVYSTVFLRLKSATPGKLALGLRVRRWDDTGAVGSGAPRLGWGTAVGRWAVEVLPGQVIPLWTLLDYLWCTWDAKRQTLHDKVVGTTVVSTRR